MEQFPILVEHGPTIWRLIQVGVVVLIIVAIWASRHAIARGELRAALRRVRANHGAIRGTLRGGGATTVTVRANTQLVHGVASWRADALWIETPDRKIELVGPVHVVAGTRYEGKRRRLPVLTVERRDAVKTALPWSNGQIHSALAVHLAAGDEIEVRGTIGSQAGQGEAHAREADIAWTLRGDDAPLQLAATRPTIPKLPLGVMRTALIAIVAFGVSSILLDSYSEHWRSECLALRGTTHRDKPVGDAPVALDNGHACVLDASTPMRREAGLEALHDYLENHPYRDDHTVERLDALARRVVDCPERLDDLLTSRRFEVALEEARRCADRRVEHQALVALGHFEAAAVIRVPAGPDELPALPSLSTLIAAGRWVEASASVRAQPTDNRDHRQSKECVGDWFLHLAGDREATARLLAAAPGSPCEAVLAALDPTRHDRGSSFASFYEPEDLLVRPEYAYNALELWLPYTDGPSLSRRADRLRWRAVKQVLDNDPEGALATARQVVELAREIRKNSTPDDFLFTSRSPVVLIPAIELYTPTIFERVGEQLAEAAKNEAEHAERMTGEPRGRPAGDIDEHDLLRYSRLFARGREPLVPERTRFLDDVAVAARDGRMDRVLSIVQSRRYVRWHFLDLLAVVPHLTGIHPQLRRELPHAPLRSYPFRSEHLASRAVDAFAYRELLEAVGATAPAARWDAIYRRYNAMLSDPVRAKALTLTE